MLLWLLLLVLGLLACGQLSECHLGFQISESAPEIGQSGKAPKAFLLLNPPWSTAFKGETVTLTCKAPYSPAQGVVVWRDKYNLLKYRSEDITIKESGIYKCKTQQSSFSDPVYVKFSSDTLILQAPHLVFEGEDLILRCRVKKNNIDEKTYYKDGKILGTSNNTEFILKSVPPGNGKYSCGVYDESWWILTKYKKSEPLQIQVQELFARPVLRVSPSPPTEGSPVTLKCETQLHPQRSHIQLQFSFFKANQALGSGWSSSPELQIPTVWSEDTHYYSCLAQTETHRVQKRSFTSLIKVQRVPVSGVSLVVRPPQGQLIEGGNLVLICSVAKGTGTITFSWHREGTSSLGRKVQRSLSAELQIPSVMEHHAGRYYCSADNIHGPVLSKWITVTLKIPASRPVLTLRTPGAQAVVGDLVELHCEAQRGSPPILYRFYHEDITLGNSLAPSGGGVSFNLSLSEEHSGNYSCEADNGLGAQHSDRVTVNILVPVSHPVLTLMASTQAVVGDMVELHCEAQRGSPPILYRFYHEDVNLGNSSAPSGGGVSFNLSLTAEHSGNYSCEAYNGLAAQRSEMLTLNFPVPSRNKITQITVGVVGALLSLAASAALVGHLRKRSGGLSVPGTRSANDCQEPSLSRSAITAPPVPTHDESPVLMELQPVYSNVNPGDNDLVYSQILNIRQKKENSANSPRMHQKDKERTVIYSELRNAHRDDFAGQASSSGSAHEDAAENYENVSHAILALDH